MNRVIKQQDTYRGPIFNNRIERRSEKKTISKKLIEAIAYNYNSDILFHLEQLKKLSKEQNHCKSKAIKEVISLREWLKLNDSLVPTELNKVNIERCKKILIELYTKN